ncbi:MAG: hypothetical protein AABX00_06475 [Nanoarchaeota archaeon]
MPDAIDMAMDSIKSEIIDIKAKISQCRKKGFDTKIAVMMMMEIPARIKLIEATRELKEVSKINKLVMDAKAEIAEAEKNGEEQKKNKETDAIVEKISDIADASMEELKYRNINKARAGYTDALGMYNSLPEDRKKEVREQLEKLRSKLS